MDRRLWPANTRVASVSLQGQIENVDFVSGTARQAASSVVDLLSAPDGARDRQLQMGDGFTVFEDRDGWSFGQTKRDGYCGYVRSSTLVDQMDVTHTVAARATHLYTQEDFKSPEKASLSFGAKLKLVDERHKFFETQDGLFVPKKHVRPVEHRFSDPVNIAQLHFGAPYLWGGNSSFGIDCSGLIQAALLACGIACPGDSDMQKDGLGKDISEGDPLQRGDILFWKGHVGMMVDADTLIHANAHHMAVAYEPIMAAIIRIEAQGDGPVTARKRLA